jgi:ribosomal protein S18 acetylase RimI-like enzyme
MGDETLPEASSSLAQAERETRDLISRAGPEALRVDDLVGADLPHIAWSGNPSHLRNVEGQLARAAGGEVEYLAVRSPSGAPVAKGGIDYKQHEGAGTMFQLATLPSLQGLGIARRLIGAAEDRIRERGLFVAMLGVEDDNDRARTIYQRLGYEACGHEEDSWETEDEHGNKHTKHAQITLLKKHLV